LVGTWWPIAKAEFLVRTAKLHRARKLLYPGLILISVLLVLIGIPTVVSFLLGRFGVAFDTILATSLPGLMRTMMLVIWLMVLIVPLSNSLENLKTDQWDILFSSNAKTRDILFGTYLGKVPVYGLITLVLSSVIVAPFVYAYNVSIVGQLLMYAILILFGIATIWISNVLSTALHAKIGQSPRGDDIAKALSWAMVPIMFLPSMSAIYWTDAIVSMMGLEVSMLLPSTWVADLLTWISVSESSLLPSSIVNIQNYWIQFSPAISLVLVSGFVFAVYIIGFRSADSLFTLNAGLGANKVTTVGRENIAIRGVRRIFGSKFGTIVVTSLKDFTRKLQNVAKISYATFLSLMIPLLLATGPFGAAVGDPIFVPVMSCLSIGMMLGIFGGIVFGGIGLLDSQDQLWILKGAPAGIPKFIAARVLSYMMLASIIALLPSVFTGFFLHFTLSTTILMFAYVYSIIVSGIFIGVGITSFNPSYQDTSSSAFTINTVATILITLISLMAGFIPGVIIAITQGAIAPALMIASIPAPIVGLIILVVGSIKLNISEVV
jgi:hypothetical protein